MDWLNKLVKTIDHNRWTVLGLAAAAVLIAVMVGCSPTTASVVTGEPVDAATFQREAITAQAELEAQAAALAKRIEAFEASVAAGTADLQQQVEVRRELLDIAGGALMDLAGGQVNPAAYVLPGLSALGLALGIGSTLDNRRKDKVIEHVKAEQPGRGAPSGT